MLSTYTHDINIEALSLEDTDPKYCYATGYNEDGYLLVGCCLLDEGYHPNHETRDGKVVHVDPDEGPFTEIVRPL